MLARLAKDLAVQHGRGFSERNLRKMRAFYLGWEIWQTPSAKSGHTFVSPIVPVSSGSSLHIELFVFPPAGPHSALFVAVYKSIGADCQQGIHASFLMEEAAIMHIDVKLPLVV